MKTTKTITALALLCTAFMTNVYAENSKYDIKLKNNSNEPMRIEISYDNPNFLDTGTIELRKVDSSGKRLPASCEATDTCKTKLMVLVVDPNENYEKQDVELNNAFFQLYVGDKKQFGQSMERKLVRDIKKKGNFEIIAKGNKEL